MDARGGKGWLTVSTGKSADGIYVEVKDTGIGLDGETASKMFEPFFTTKATGKGIGLGLSIVKRIVMEHHGSTKVESKPGQGCSVTIHLPIADCG